jgi:hypothetical protein
MEVMKNMEDMEKFWGGAAGKAKEPGLAPLI